MHPPQASAGSRHHPPVPAGGSNSSNPWVLAVPGAVTLDNHAPGPTLSAGTLVSGAVDLDFTADTTVVDGYTENCPGWSIPMANLLPNYTPGEDLLEILLEIGTMPADGSRRGIGVGLLNQAAPSGSIGACAGVVDQSATQRQIRGLGASALFGNNNVTAGDLEAILLGIRFAALDAHLYVVRKMAGAWETTSIMDQIASWGSLADTHLRIFGLVGTTATASTYSLDGTVSVRRSKVGTLPA